MSPVVQAPRGGAQGPRPRPARGASGRRLPASRRSRRLRRLVAGVVSLALLAVLVVPAVVATRVVQVGGRDERPQADALVVLGASQLDGEPAAVLRARLEHALALYQAGVAPVVVTTGANQEGDRFTEAGAGADWLVARGVPADAVVAVEQGGNTYDSLLPVSRLAAERGWDGVVVVSDPWHLYRVRVMADTVDLPVAGASPVPDGPSTQVPTRIASYVARETAGVLAHQSAVALDKARAAAAGG